MDGDTTGLWRDALADVLAALTGDPLEWWQWEVAHAESIVPGALAVVCKGAALSVVRRDGGVFWSVTDPRAAMELLQVRGLAPEDDERRAFAERSLSDRGWDEWKIAREAPATLPELVAWASLGREAISRAEALAWQGAHLLTFRPQKIVWRVVPRGVAFVGVALWQWERMRVTAKERGVPAPCDELHAMGLVWLEGDDRAITLVVPFVGGAP